MCVCECTAVCECTVCKYTAVCVNVQLWVNVLQCGCAAVCELSAACECTVVCKCIAVCGCTSVWMYCGVNILRCVKALLGCEVLCYCKGSKSGRALQEQYLLPTKEIEAHFCVVKVFKCASFLETQRESSLMNVTIFFLLHLTQLPFPVFRF